jgi:hypothetical protein
VDIIFKVFIFYFVKFLISKVFCDDGCLFFLQSNKPCGKDAIVRKQQNLLLTGMDPATKGVIWYRHEMMHP